MKISIFAFMTLAGVTTVLHHANAELPRPDELKTRIVNDYVKIQESLINDALPKLRIPAQDIQKLSTLMGMSDQNDSIALRKSARAIDRSSKLEDARNAFKDLSKPVISWVRKFDFADLEIGECPMARAQWVQMKGEIRNPYLGKDMISCGAKPS